MARKIKKQSTPSNSYTLFVLPIILSILFGVLFHDRISNVINVYHSTWADSKTTTTITRTTSKSTASVVTVSKTLKGLENIANSSTLLGCSRVAVGYNANLDLIVKATDLWERLKFNEQNSTLVDHDKISTLVEFQETFMYFFEKGSAAERYIENKELFDKIINTAKNLPSYAQIWHPGGNAMLMANRFAKEGCEQVLLGGVVDKHLGTLLHPKVQVAKLPENPKSLDIDEEVMQEQKNDQVHLILEYEKGANLGQYYSPRANRFIVVRDEPNSKIEALETFHRELPLFNPVITVIAGLHLLEGQSNDYRDTRLQDVVTSIDSSNNSPIHLELASVGDITYMKQLATTVLPHVNSLGLNEQELATVYLSLGGKDFQRDSFKDPQVRVVVDSLKYVFSALEPYTSQLETRVLTRIHFHCLTFHLIAELKGSWNHSVSAVAAGSLAATKQACDMENINTDEVELLVSLQVEKSQIIGSQDSQIDRYIDPNEPVLVWKEGDTQFYLAPVLVCKVPKKTVGLGDSISTMGLLYEFFSK